MAGLGGDEQLAPLSALEPCTHLEGFVDGHGRDVTDRQLPGERRLAELPDDEAGHVVERGGDDAAVSAPGRAFEGAPKHDACNHRFRFELRLDVDARRIRGARDGAIGETRARCRRWEGVGTDSGAHQREPITVLHGFELRGKRPRVARDLLELRDIRIVRDERVIEIPQCGRRVDADFVDLHGGSVRTPARMSRRIPGDHHSLRFPDQSLVFDTGIVGYRLKGCVPTYRYDIQREVAALRFRSPSKFRPAFRRDRALGGVLAAVLGVAVAIPAFGIPAASAAGPAKFPGTSWAKAIGPTHLSSPVVADVNGDGRPDVLTTDLSGMLHVFDGRTGRDLPGWPQPVQVVPGQTVAVESSPTVADLDHNGHVEIIVGAGSIDVAGQQGGVGAFNANGSGRWRIRTMTLAGESGVNGTPAVGDVNGDGFPDVVFGSFDHRIYVVDRHGNALPGFPVDSLDTIWDSPALYDEAHIGRMDIFLGGDASPGGPCGNQSWSGILRAIRVTSAGPRILWSHCQHQIFQSSPAIGNFSGDGRMDLVIGTGTGPSGDARATNSLNAYHLDNGSPVAGWPVLLNGPIFGSPVIGDVNGDHKNDVVVGACATCAVGRVWAFNGHGRLLWSVVPGGNLDNTEILSTPILVDLDGNGVNDVAIGQAGQFYFLRGRDGARLYQPVEVGRIMQNSAAVANFGRGVGWRLIVQSWRPQGGGLPRNGSGRVASYRLPKAPKVTPAWPQWRLNPRHTASPPAPPLPPSNAGYWLVAADGGMFAFGNAKFHGSTGGMHLNQPIVGMARTRSGNGYWLVARDGGMFSFGDAKFHGSTGGKHLNQPIVGMARTPSGRGYWLVARDGGMFSFGDAHFYGSTGGKHLNQPIVGMAPTPSGHGYWLVARDGGMFSFGDAKFHGSTGGIRLNQPIVGMTPTIRGHGYWLVAADGGMFSFGDAKFHGSTGGQPLVAPITTITLTPSGRGYWLIGANGDVFPFGDARFYGSTGGQALNSPIVAAAASRHS